MFKISCHAFKLGMGREQDARTERDFAIIDIKVSMPNSLPQSLFPVPFSLFPVPLSSC